MMKVAILLCLVAVAMAVPLPEPEADPSLLLLPHGHHYPLYSPFINAIKDEDTGVYTYPNGLLAPESRYPFAYGYHGYPAGYPYPLYPYGVKPASEK